MEFSNTRIEGDTKINPDTEDDGAKVGDVKDSKSANIIADNECHNVCGLNFLILATFVLMMIILLFRLLTSLTPSLRYVIIGLVWAPVPGSSSPVLLLYYTKQVRGIN